jgi:aminoglycoside phosphotransferase (APT) family kinase protein
VAKHDLGDLEKIRTALEAWLRIQLPDAQALTLGELSFPEESGESSVSLILKTQNKGESKGYICRMKPRESQVFDEHDLPMQYHLMSIAAKEGIPVPPLHGFEQDESLVGSDFYIMGFVEGTVPTDNPPYAFGGWVVELSELERKTMWSNGLQVMARIHQIDLDKHDFPLMPSSDPAQAPIQHELEKLEVLMTPDVRANLHEVVKDAVLFLNKNAPMDGSRRLCWGDSRPGNVIWKNLEPNAVIDWEMACLGDPMQDVSWWYWVDYINSVGLGVTRLGGLPSLEEIYNKWHELTGLPIAHAYYYNLFSVVRYAIILQKKFSSMEKAGMGRIDNFVVPFVEQQLEIFRTHA